MSWHPEFALLSENCVPVQHFKSQVCFLQAWKTVCLEQSGFITLLGKRNVSITAVLAASFRQRAVSECTNERPVRKPFADLVLQHHKSTSSKTTEWKQSVAKNLIISRAPTPVKMTRSSVQYHFSGAAPVITFCVYLFHMYSDLQCISLRLKISISKRGESEAP